MEKSMIASLLEVLKKICICEKCGFNETKNIIQEANMGDLDELLEENGVNTLDVIESIFAVKDALEEEFEGFESTPEGVKTFFNDVQRLPISDKEAREIYEKYLLPH